MLQSIRAKALRRQVVCRPQTPRRWSRLGGRRFHRSLPPALWVVVVFPAVVFGMPAASIHPSFTIHQLFQDPRTRITLQAMAGADLPLARGVVDFLLAFAGTHPGSGDALIQWDATDTSDYNDGAQMHLNGTSFDPNNPYALASFAGQITHEAVEIYFAQADGVPGNTLPMDYLAEYEGGLVMRAVAGALDTPVPQIPGTGTGQIDTVGRSYADWLANGNGPAYHEGSDSGTSWHFFWWSGPLGDHPLFGNPMGLSLAMLRWETTCGGETLPDWQARGCT